MSIQLPVEVKYLHHRGPDHRDSPERRADKARISAAARRYEGRYFVTVATPIEHWTAADVEQLLEAVRTQLPTRDPDPESGDPARLFGLADADGRSIHTLRCTQRGGHNGQALRSCLWFSTLAGFSATIVLPVLVPASVLTAVGHAARPWIDVEWHIDGRALAAQTRRTRTDDERRASGRPPLKRAVLASAFETAYRATETGQAPAPFEPPDDRIAYVVRERPYPEGSETTRRVRLPWGGALDLIRQAARLVPGWVPLTAQLRLSSDASPSTIELDFGTDDAGVRTRVAVELEVPDLAAVVPTMLQSLRGRLTGTITATLGDVGDGGEELPVPTISEEALRQMTAGGVLQ